MDTSDIDPFNHSADKSPYFEPCPEKKGPTANVKPEEEKCPQQDALEELSRQRTDPNNYPEGGLQAWLVVFGSFCGTTACFGLTNSIGVVHTYVANNILTDYSDGQIGWIFSVYLFITMAGGVLGGPIFDLYGPRWMICIGGILLTLGIMMTSLATAYWQFLMAFGILTGIGTSLVFTSSFAAPGHWFLRRRGLATGIAATGGSVGGVIVPLMMQSLIPKIGFEWALRSLGFLIFGLSVVANILVRSRLPPLPNSNVFPDFYIFKQIPFTLLTIAVMTMELALFVPITYISSYAVDMGLGTALSYQLVAILNAGSFFGRILAGFAADMMGRFNTLAFCVFLCMVSCVAFWLPAGSNTAIVIMFAISFGFASGSNVSLIPVCVGQLCRTEEYGRYYATLYTVVSIGPLVGVPIGGTILQSSNGHYWSLIIFTAIVYGCSVALIMVARGIARGWSLKIVF
ncbi:hypothetical protein BROUX41_000391 [Berkeleyomyces rouxiae]|uniref:uncharacterized protein n=1 Tax=Berkeleyomyces rouxiae TaxID=2035830 RepID=UPI003B7B09E6